MICAQRSSQFQFSAGMGPVPKGTLGSYENAVHIAASPRPAGSLTRQHMQGTTAQRGYGGRWQRERHRFLDANPLCVMCSKEHRVTAATVVDHIKPHKGDPELMWDQMNWQPLCATHHNSDKQSIDKGGKPKQRIGPDGWPED